MANETAEVHKADQLVGTTSVEKSELLSSLLAEQDIPHNLLNAKPENVELTEIVAQAAWPARLSPPTWRAAAPTSSWAVPAITWPGQAAGGATPRLVKPRRGTSPVPLQLGGGRFLRGGGSPAGPQQLRLYLASSAKIMIKLGWLARDLVKAWGDRPHCD